MREKQPSFFKTSESVAESDWELALDWLGSPWVGCTHGTAGIAGSPWTYCGLAFPLEKEVICLFVVVQPCSDGMVLR